MPVPGPTVTATETVTEYVPAPAPTVTVTEHIRDDNTSLEYQKERDRVEDERRRTG